MKIIQSTKGCSKYVDTNYLRYDSLQKKEEVFELINGLISEGYQIFESNLIFDQDHTLPIPPKQYNEIEKLYEAIIQFGLEDIASIDLKAYINNIPINFEVCPHSNLLIVTSSIKKNNLKEEAELEEKAGRKM